MCNFSFLYFSFGIMPKAYTYENWMENKDSQNNLEKF